MLGLLVFILANAVIDIHYMILILLCTFSLCFIYGCCVWFDSWFVSLVSILIRRPYSIFHARVQFFSYSYCSKCDFFSYAYVSFAGLPRRYPVYIDDAWFFHSICTYEHLYFVGNIFYDYFSLLYLEIVLVSVNIINIKNNVRERKKNQIFLSVIWIKYWNKV